MQLVILLLHGNQVSDRFDSRNPPYRELVVHMKKIITVILSVSLFLTCLGLCGLHERTAEGVSFSMRGGDPEELMRGGDGDVDFIRLLKDEVLDINSATAKELEKLPSIGKVLAQAIVDYREEHGSFADIDDVKLVEGIGEGRFEAIRDRIKVGELSGSPERGAVSDAD